MKIIDVTSKHVPLDDKSRAYAEKKVRKLIDYIPRHARKSAKAEVKIVRNETKSADNIKCEIILALPDKQLVASDVKDGILAAIDSVELKIRGQIRRYKTERRTDGVRTGGIMAKIKKSLRRRKQ